MKELSPRLDMLLSLMPEAVSCCDIGTDHGYLAAALARRCERVIASDVNRAPLESARENMRRLGIKNVELRLSDGFSAIAEGEVQGAFLSGMGGDLIRRIILRGTKGMNWLVLQPQSLIHELRAYLTANGFVICDEALCREDMRFYVGMLVRPGRSGPLSEAELLVGPVLLRKRPPLLVPYLLRRIELAEQAKQKIGLSGEESAAAAEYERLIKLYGGIIDGEAQRNN